MRNPPSIIQQQSWKKWIVWITPVILLILGRQLWTAKNNENNNLLETNLGPFSSSSSSSFSSSFHPSQTYLLISKPQNLISISLIQQLYPATVYLAYSPSEEGWIMQEVNQERFFPPSTKFCLLDPIGGTNSNNNNNNNKDEEEKEDFMKDCLDKLPPLIDGVIFNPYGSVGDGSFLQHSLSVQYKLMTPLEILHRMIMKDDDENDGGENTNDTYGDIPGRRQRRLKPNGRILFVGSEAARGLPDLGFPTPQLGDSISSIQSFLTGEAYRRRHKEEEEEEDGTSGEMGVHYRWEDAYGDLAAILVLYIQHLSKLRPDLYLAVVSPGMTDESFKPENSPRTGLLWMIQLWAFRTILFQVLCQQEIAKPSSHGARLLLNALLPGEEYPYPSGTFVAAIKGTGGPVGDQSKVPGGQMFLDERLQEVVYQAVNDYMEKR